ncbi:hypothetical protein C8F01DRAFT_1224502 [Mycena amicta]|nr:hypothetical protein C8F01DRAFT_1224502 [Mycena amicta]
MDRRARNVTGQRTGGRGGARATQGVFSMEGGTVTSAHFGTDLLFESTTIKPRRAIGRIVSTTSTPVGIDRGREKPTVQLQSIPLLQLYQVISTLQPPLAHHDRASRTRTAHQPLPSATLSSPTHLPPDDPGIGASMTDTTTRADWTMRREEDDASMMTGPSAGAPRLSRCWRPTERGLSLPLCAGILALM